MTNEETRWVLEFTMRRRETFAKSMERLKGRHDVFRTQPESSKATRAKHQKLPATGPERESLRQKGQFWTPAWVAEAMAAYVLANGSDHILDPAVGEGAFLRAGKAVAREFGQRLELLGREVDPNALEQARLSGLTDADLSGVQIEDFVLRPPVRRYKAIIANPPYIRHHRLSAHTKAALREFGREVIGSALDGRAGLHIYFLLRALTLLEEGGRLAFIMPADTCEGKFASPLWKWIINHYRLATVLTFAHDASPFPGVDTNPLVFFIERVKPETNFIWAKCVAPDTSHLKEWVLSGFKLQSEVISARERSITEGIATGLSRSPSEENQTGSLTLSAFAKVMRGIATGANDYFFLTRKQAADLGLPQEFLFPAVGRTRDVSGDVITRETMKALDESGRPTLLFSPSGSAPDSFPRAMLEYLKQGEGLGLNQRTLIATRKPWYKMETRSVPPILFAYLGRRNARFIRNYAGALPLTGFLCIYPHSKDARYVEQLWEVLQHPETVKNLSRVGKSYGAGAIKVEPRSLEQLPLPQGAIAECGLTQPNKGPAGEVKLVSQKELFAA